MLYYAMKIIILKNIPSTRTSIYFSEIAGRLQIDDNHSLFLFLLSLSPLILSTPPLSLSLSLSSLFLSSSQSLSPPAYLFLSLSIYHSHSFRSSVIPYSPLSYPTNDLCFRLLSNSLSSLSLSLSTPFTISLPLFVTYIRFLKVYHWARL